MMTGLLLVLGLLVAIVMVLCLIDSRTGRARQQASPARVRRELSSADQQINSEFRRTRRAMNDAAGQSWRNLAE